MKQIQLKSHLAILSTRLETLQFQLKDTASLSSKRLSLTRLTRKLDSLKSEIHYLSYQLDQIKREAADQPAKTNNDDPARQKEKIS